MALIVEKIIRALSLLIILWYWGENLSYLKYSDLVFDSVVVSIISVLALLNFRSFSFLGYIPKKNNIFQVLAFYALLTFVLLYQKNEWWYITILVPFAKYSFYLEKKIPKLYYISNILTIIIFTPLVIYNLKFLIVILLPNFAIGFYIFCRDLFYQNKFIRTEDYISNNLIKYAYPLFINSLLIVLYTKIDVFLVDYLSSKTEFKSEYFTTVKIVDYIIMMPVTYISYSLRFWVDLKKPFSKYYDYRFIIFISFLIIVPSLIIFPVMDNFLILNTKVFLFYLSIVPVITLNTIRNNILIVLEKNWNVAVYSLISIILNICFSIYFFNFFGIWSVLYGTLFAQIILVFPSIYTIFRNYKIVSYKKL